MSRRITRRPRARQDIINCAMFIAEDDPAAARRFVDAVEQALRLLVDMPRIGAPRAHGGIKDLRMWRVPGFSKHLIFYRVTEGGIEAIRVLHGARDLRGLLEG